MFNNNILINDKSPFYGAFVVYKDTQPIWISTESLSFYSVLSSGITHISNKSRNR